jgi:hypothetical protein
MSHVACLLILRGLLWGRRRAAAAGGWESDPVPQTISASLGRNQRAASGLGKRKGLKPRGGPVRFLGMTGGTAFGGTAGSVPATGTT